MKKLHRLLLLSYAGSFLLTFFISIFVFLMIFVFVYLDDFIGKNLGIGKLPALFFYFSLKTVPRALPLATLLASVMTFGSLAEHSEITAMKSAGISFSRIALPLFLFTFAAGIFLFFFSNFFLPSNNLRLQTLLINIRTARPSLMFREGAFNNELQGYSFRFGKIGKDGKTVGDILMYDNTAGMGNTTVLYAKSGTIREEKANGMLLFTVYDGASYRELTGRDNSGTGNGLIRERFKERTFRFDMSGHAQTVNLKNDYEVQNLWQTQHVIDSLKKEDDLLQKQICALQRMPAADTISKEVLAAHGEFMQRFRKYSEYLDFTLGINRDMALKYQVEWHKRAASGFTCLVLFLIGAPLGYIIRKGGLGMPLVVSTVLYILFHVLSIIGEKLAENEILQPFAGAWLPTAILLPAGLYLFNTASSDRAMPEGRIFTRARQFFIRKKED